GSSTAATTATGNSTSAEPTAVSQTNGGPLTADRLTTRFHVACASPPATMSSTTRGVTGLRSVGRREVEEFLDAPEESGLEIAVAAHRREDALPRGGDVRLIVVRPAEGG